MKKINLFLITMLISTVLFAQKLAVNEVPAQLISDLKTRYPAAEKTNWVKDNAIIKVSFVNDGSNMEINYQNNNWLQTKWVFSIEYTPQKIKDYLTQFYLGYKIKDFAFLDKNNGERIYEVVIFKKKKPDMTLVFDSSNNFLRIADDVKKVEEVKKAN